MTYLALYRKYRPQSFQDLVGQDAIRQTLLNAAKKKRIAQVYLFSGPRGTGKTTAARLVAKMLNCEQLQETGEPCNTCRTCEDIQNGRMIDVIEIDGASNRGIDEVRALRENALFHPTQAKKKVFIIDEVHMLTKEAFNALLKILEEPMDHVHFILATTELHKIPATILSRAQCFDFRRLTPETIADRLAYVCTQENIAADTEALQIIARIADGSLRDALVLVEQLTHDATLTTAQTQENLGLVQQELIEEFLQLIELRKINSSLEFIQRIYADGTDLIQFTRDLVSSLRNKMIVAVQEQHISRAQYFSKLIGTFVKAIPELKSTMIPQLPLELAVLELEEATGEPRTTPVVEQVAAATQKAHVEEVRQAAPVTDLSPLSLAKLREHWPQIIAKVAAPKIRLTLRTAKLHSVVENKLTLLFPSQFELEQVNSAQGRGHIEDAIESVLSEKIQIVCEHNPAAQPVSIVTQTIPHPLTSKKATVEDAMSILGGTLIPE